MNPTTTDRDLYKFTIQPSQWVNIGWLLLTIGGLFVLEAYPAIFFGLIWFYNVIRVSVWKFQFHERTMTERWGIFNVNKREIHYFRIKSIRIERPLWMRFFGLTNVILVTSDPYIPLLALYGIHDGEKIRNYFKEQAHQWRQKFDVKERDFHDF